MAADDEDSATRRQGCRMRVLGIPRREARRSGVPRRALEHALAVHQEPRSGTTMCANGVSSLRTYAPAPAGAVGSPSSADSCGTRIMRCGPSMCQSGVGPIATGSVGLLPASPTSRNAAAGVGTCGSRRSIRARSNSSPLPSVHMGSCPDAAVADLLDGRQYQPLVPLRSMANVPPGEEGHPRTVACVAIAGGPPRWASAILLPTHSPTSGAVGVPATSRWCAVAAPRATPTGPACT